MIHTLPLLCLAATCVALAVSGLRLADQATDGLVQPVAVRIQSEPSSLPVPTISPVQISFQPIFGRVAPVEASVPEPQSALPTVAHRLIGTVVHQDLRYAILNGPGGELVLREGETLAPGGRIVRIRQDRIDVDFRNGQITLALETPPAGTQRPAPPDVEAPPPPAMAASTPYRAMVKSAAMSLDDVQTLVTAAEARLASR